MQTSDAGTGDIREETQERRVLQLLDGTHRPLPEGSEQGAGNAIVLAEERWGGETGMNDTYLKEATFQGIAGGNVFNTLREVHDWFYTGNGKDCERAVVRHLNGIKVTFEREGAP